jgi:L-threonylcarbamoyladenylate synthase
MYTRIIKISDLSQQQADIDEAGRLLLEGQIVAFPTETVYGLGANGLDAEACAAIYEAKGRPSDNPLILHVADRAMIDGIAREVPEMAEKLIAAFCPGPITLILPRAECVPLRITGGLDTVGIRMPGNDIARAMIKSAKVPIAAPSANISGRPSPTTAASVYRDMEGKIPLILDGGLCHFGVESTIVDCAGKIATILRPGAVTREMLQEVVGEVKIDPALVGAKVVPKAPGMKYRHYAPKAPLTLIEGAPAKMVPAFRRELRRLQAAGKSVGIIVSDEVAAALQGRLAEDLVCSFGAQADLYAIAANLYEDLRSFDDKPVDCLLAEGTTEEGLGLAIMNRLHKASGFHSIRA